MKASLILFMLCLPLLLCASCAKPEIITQTEIVEVKIPVRCEVEMPKKPAFDKSPKGTKALLEYFVQCEQRLRYCIGETSPPMGQITLRPAARSGDKKQH